MEEVSIRELKNRTSEVLRHVRELKDPVGITYRGRVVANIVPVEKEPETEKQKTARVWAEMDKLAMEISARWPAGVSAVEVIREERGDL